MLLMGLQKLTLLDFPGKIACTVFTGGCDFRCPFCHNASLVRLHADAPRLPEEEFFKFLNMRKGVLQGVCITGGEPTLQPDLADFIKKIRELGFKVKLDTNGNNPEVLKSLVSEGLIDYVAMDIKNSPESYGRTVGIENFDLSNVTSSVEFLLGDNVDYEFRTTLVRQLHTESDIKSIGEWIKGAKHYYLQAFIDSGDLLSDNLDGFTKDETENLLNLLKPCIKSAEIRGF